MLAYKNRKNATWHFKSHTDLTDRANGSQCNLCYMCVRVRFDACKCTCFVSCRVSYSPTYSLLVIL